MAGSRRMSSMVAAPIILQPEENSQVKKMTPHLPGLVLFANHQQKLPWTSTCQAVVMFADISGFTALCESYSLSENAGSGIDKLTRTLNAYLSALVEGILASDGDVLKFAGDAILAAWRVNYQHQLPGIVDKVTSSCLDIQNKCGEWDTDIGIKLTVKMGISAGTMDVVFLGNDEFRHYIEVGPAIKDVNVAESFCLSGYVVLSPDAWALARQSLYTYEVMEDEKHVRVLSLKEKPPRITRDQIREGSLLSEPTFTAYLGSNSLIVPTSPMKLSVANVLKKPMLRSMKLQKMVKTVTNMKLEETLRLYILQPVLEKLDDNQPLHYLSEMRQVSIIFMNMVLVESPDVSSLLQQMFSIVHTESKAMNGCMNKVFLFDKGCSFLVIFGLPGYMHNKDCTHALQCADKMSHILHNVEGVLKVSIGVTTGTTFCGVVGHTKRYEYSVIGRKVNMAARLMMHYPGKVTCDDLTFHLCQLPATNFEVLMTKRMKGLRDVGIVREFSIQEDSDTMALPSIPQFKYPLIGHEQEMVIFKKGLQLCKTHREPGPHFIFAGVAGIGKTRFIDAVLVEAAEKNACIISCVLDLLELSKPFSLVRYVLRMMLTNAGFSHQVGRDQHLVDSLVSHGLVLYVYLLNDILGLSVKKPESINPERENENNIRHKMLMCLAQVCLEKMNNVLIVAVDDAHNIDNESWCFMNEMSKLTGVMLLMTLRPFALETPSCFAASKLMSSEYVSIIEIRYLNVKFLSALACQHLEVVSIPQDLDKLLRERSFGVPVWCKKLLDCMIENKQLEIVFKKGMQRQNYTMITPNRKYTEPRKVENKENEQLTVPTILPKPQATTSTTSKEYENLILASFGFVVDAKDGKTKEKEEMKGDKIARFSSSVNPRDIAVPESMKELVITRLDSMRASEQLIVKCAAVLGRRFRRHVLEGILPHSKNYMDTRLAIKHLIQLGIFECGNMPAWRHDEIIYGEVDTLSGQRCYCPENINRSGRYVYVCVNPCFRNGLLQQTAYGLLLENQKLELHRKAASYLEKKADDLRAMIPRHVFEILPEAFIESQDGNTPTHSDGNTPTHSDVNTPTHSDVNTPTHSDVNTPTHSDVNTPTHSDGNTPTHSDGNTPTHSDDRTKQPVKETAQHAPCNTFLQADEQTLVASRESVMESVESLLDMLKDIQYHWSAAKEQHVALLTLIEAVTAALVVDNNVLASEMLNEVDKLLEFVGEQQLQSPEMLKFVHARIFRLKAKVQFNDENYDETYELLMEAAEILDQISMSKDGKVSRKIHLAQQLYKLFKRNRTEVHSKQQCTCTEYETSLYLESMYYLRREYGQQDLMLSYALQNFFLVSSMSFPIHRTVVAYRCLTECFDDRNWNKWKKTLAKELFSKCAKQSEELSAEDVLILDKMSAHTLPMSPLNKDELKQASHDTEISEKGKKKNSFLVKKWRRFRSRKIDVSP